MRSHKKKINGESVCLSLFLLLPFSPHSMRISVLNHKIRSIQPIWRQKRDHCNVLRFFKVFSWFCWKFGCSQLRVETRNERKKTILIWCYLYTLLPFMFLIIAMIRLLFSTTTATKKVSSITWLFIGSSIYSIYPWSTYTQKPTSQYSTKKFFCWPASIDILLCRFISLLSTVFMSCLILS